MDDLQPGRPLDVMIARKVMGLNTVGEAIRIPMGELFHTVEEVPHYSTDIAAAWEVWDKLPGPRRLHQCDNGLYTVMCGGIDYGEFTDYVEGVYADDCETAAHAICLAALKAVNQ